MKKLFKFLLKTLLWLIAILLIVVVVAYFTASLWIKPVVSSVVPKITRTSASLDSADISLFSGRLALKGLKIGNPEGFKEPYVFELGEISIRFQPKTIFSNKIIVDQVLIKGTQILAEYNKSAQMNLLVLNDNVNASLGGGKSTKTGNAPAKGNTQKQAKSNKAVVIRDLQFLDSKLHFAMGGHVATLNLPNIKEKNIGEKKKVTWAESIQLILEKLTLEPLQEIAKSSQQLLKDAFKVVEQHTPDKKTVGKLKDMISAGFGF